MKLLVCIPSLSNAGGLAESLSSVVGREGVDIVVCSNGGTAEVNEVIKQYGSREDVKVWDYATNVYVNPVWNDFMKHFLDHAEYTHMVLMNDDLTLHYQWWDVLRKRWEADPNEIILPVITNDAYRMGTGVDTHLQEAIPVYSGTPGIFITMNREQALACFPISPEIKLWFGDDYLFGIMRSKWTSVIPVNFFAAHSGSMTVNSLPGKAGLIEQDKVKWVEHVETLMQERIKKLKGA